MSKYFGEHETKCHCGCGLDLLDSFKVKLDKMREAVNMPLILNSAARCQTYNFVKGGKPEGYHPKCRAADIKWDHMHGGQKLILLDYALRHFGGIGQCKEFLHVDDRELKTIFFY